MGSKVNMGWPPALALRANSIPGCVKRSQGHRQSKEVIPLTLLMRPHLQYHIQFWGPQYKKYTNKLSGLQWRASRTGRAGALALSGEAEGAGLVPPAEGMALWGLTAAFWYLRGGYREDKAKLFTLVHGGRTRGHGGGTRGNGQN